ncbi:MAG: G-D-S-L family lipolytic protein [Leptolyngbyaceae cyanobacterium SM2_3_12]|nr:G-D-S-L family lipolytic protein [Leptolyngbyaceae cyanobacterium SM2_3_12]
MGQGAGEVPLPAEPSPLTRPVSGDQLFQFRMAAVQAGDLYTRTSPQRYVSQWQRALESYTYQDWQGLLRQEAEIMARVQGNQPLTVVVGDSLALWLPVESLPQDRLWLNQSISGETTTHVLNRLSYFSQTRPDRIYLMAGINDLKNGASDHEVVMNIDQILVQLRQQHPQAQIMVYSILPTRLSQLPGDRIRRVNRWIAAVASYRKATFLDMQPSFTDGQGQLRPELTTDGLHLSRQGYEVWESTLVEDAP